MYGYVNNISGISVVGTDAITGETTITDFNKKLQFADGLTSDTINTRIRNFYRNLSQNTYNATIVNQTTNITASPDDLPTIISPENIVVPVGVAQYLSVDIELDKPLYEVTRWYFGGVPDTQLIVVSSSGNYPHLTNGNKTVSVKFYANFYESGAYTRSFNFYGITPGMESKRFNIRIIGDDE